MEGDPTGELPPTGDEADPGVDLGVEVARLRTELDRVKRVRARRTRRIATTVLALLTTISVIASTVAFWATGRCSTRTTTWTWSGPWARTQPSRAPCPPTWATRSSPLSI